MRNCTIGKIADKDTKKRERKCSNHQYERAKMNKQKHQNNKEWKIKKRK